MMHSSAKEYMVNKIRNGLEQLEDRHRDLFNRMYPMGIENIPEDKLDWALSQVERTLDKLGRG